MATDLYRRKPITVTFDSKGGSSVNAQTGLSYGDKTTKPSDPTRTDYEFQGWYKDEDYNAAWNFDSDTLTVENVTLYAKWLKVRFSVGGTVTDSNDQPVSGATVTLENDDINGVVVTLPPEGVNSQLNVKADSDTPAVVVGGLDEEAAELKKKRRCVYRHGQHGGGRPEGSRGRSACGDSN